MAWGFEVRVSGDDLKVSVSEGAGHAPGRPSGRRKGGRGGREGACWGFDLKRELFGGGRPQKQDEEVELAVEVPWEGTRGGGGPR